MEMIHSILRSPFQLFIEYLLQNEYMFVIVALLATFGILGQWVLYYKCDLPGIASIVPLWNVVVFLRIMGRPSWQTLLFIAPPPIITYIVWTGNTSSIANVALITMLAVFLIFTIIIYIELCQCFGKRSIVDYILVIIFNGFYVMYLGMSGNTEYQGPLHGKNKQSALTES